MDEIDSRKCYLDIDKTFKRKKGIMLSIPEWRKLVKAVNYIDRRLEIAKKKMEEEKDKKSLGRYCGLITFLAC